MHSDTNVWRNRLYCDSRSQYIPISMQTRIIRALIYCIRFSEFYELEQETHKGDRRAAHLHPALFIADRVSKGSRGRRTWTQSKSLWSDTALRNFYPRLTYFKLQSKWANDCFAENSFLSDLFFFCLLKGLPKKFHRCVQTKQTRLCVSEMNHRQSCFCFRGVGKVCSVLFFTLFDSFTPAGMSMWELFTRRHCDSRVDHLSRELQSIKSNWRQWV